MAGHRRDARRTALIALESELLSGALEATSAQLGLSPFFLGIIVLAVVGNFAEYLAASYFARKGQLGLAVNIVIGGTIQVALFTAPLLVTDLVPDRQADEPGVFTVRWNSSPSWRWP